MRFFSPLLLLLSISLLFLLPSVNAVDFVVPTEVVIPWSPTQGDILAELGMNLEEMIEEATTHLDSSLPPTSQIARRPYHPRRATNDTCCSCVSGVSKHIVESVLSNVDTFCGNVSCPVLKKRCDWIEGHKEEFTGYIIGHARSHTLGYMYCYGKGECQHPNMSMIDDEIFKKHDYAYAIHQAAVAAKYIEKISPKVLDLKVLDAENPNPNLFGSDSIDLDVASSPGPTFEFVGRDSKCHQCLRHSVHWVMRRSLKHLKHFCENTKCPRMKKFCEWAEKHKEMVKGMVYAHVQPWKMAVGWCFGKGHCHCSENPASVEEATPSSPSSLIGEIMQQLPENLVTKYRRISKKHAGAKHGKKL
jgi:hypothetical protein